jgi:hypothetical protein
MPTTAVDTGAVVVADWIKRLADEERKRDAVRLGEEQAIARKAALVREDGPRLIAELRATLARDVEAFRQEFAENRSRDLSFEDTADGGFIVTTLTPTTVSLAVTPNLSQASVLCHYRFTFRTGMPAREERFELLFGGDELDKLRITHHGTGRVFATPDALSEFLLAPVFTGRPR